MLNSKIKLKIQRGLCVLERKPYLRVTSHILAGIALTLRLLPAIKPAQGVTTTQLVIAGIGLFIALIVSGPIINALSAVFGLMGYVPGWLMSTLLVSVVFDFYRRKGKAYLGSLS